MQFQLFGERPPQLRIVVDDEDRLASRHGVDHALFDSPPPSVAFRTMIFTVFADGWIKLPRRFRSVLHGAVPASKRRPSRLEGDGVSPVGTWPLRRVLYRADRIREPDTGLPDRADRVGRRRPGAMRRTIATTTARSRSPTRPAPRRCGGRTRSTTWSSCSATTMRPSFRGPARRSSCTWRALTTTSPRAASPWSSRTCRNCSETPGRGTRSKFAACAETPSRALGGRRRRPSRRERGSRQSGWRPRSRRSCPSRVRQGHCGRRSWPAGRSEGRAARQPVECTSARRSAGRGRCGKRR